MVLNCEIHQKVFIYVYLQFKSGFKGNYLALTSLKIPLILYLSPIYIQFVQCQSGGAADADEGKDMDYLSLAIAQHQENADSK